MNITLLDYNEIYDRLVSGKPYDVNLKPYTEVQLNRALEFFKEREEYEKCTIIKKQIESLDHDIGYRSII